MKLQLAGLALILAGSLSAKAQLITNGSFTTGDFTGWTEQLSTSTQNDPYDFIVVSSVGELTTTYNGTAAAFGGDGPDYDYIEQSFASTPGVTYQLTYSVLTYNNPGVQLPPGTPYINNLVADIGGTLDPNSNASTALGGGSSRTVSDDTDQLTQFTLTYQATGSVTEVIFGGDNNSAYDYLTGVSVEAAPEPSSWALLLAGAGLLALKRRKFTSRF